MMEFNDCFAIEGEDKMFEKEIVIIGAGISGLACACHLKELGFTNVKILEARSRVGGRIYGIEVGSKFIEMGAQWVHGQTDNIIYELAESNGLVNKHVFCYFDAIRSFSNFCEDESRALTMMFDFLEDRINNFSNNLGSYSFLTFLNEQFNNFLSEFGPCSFPDRLNEGFEWYCKFLAEVNGCIDLSTLSLSLLNTYKECDGNPTVEVKNGISSLLNIFLDLIPPAWILKNNLVTKIDWSDFKNEIHDLSNGCDFSFSNYIKNVKAVKVVCHGSETFLADHVVITIPLGCLKKYEQSMFFPPLSKTKQKAISCLGFGLINKVYLEFKHVFWEANAVCNVLWQQAFDEKFLKEASNKPDSYFWLKYVDRVAFTPNHHNLLCLWVTGKGAVLMETLNEDEIISDSVKLLELLFLKVLPNPTRMFRSTWMTDPFSSGSYSYLSVECEKENISPCDLAEPEFACSPYSKHPVLLFAGEATHSLHFSTVHGAYETGLREAERIFQYYRNINKIKMTNARELMSKRMDDISLNEEKLRDNLHVVIVGAGLAGLACGLQLSKSNFSKITILEAQDKIGGRLSSVRFGDSFLELGAQWIHGTDNDLFDFAKKHELLPQILKESSFEGKGKFCSSNGSVIEESIVEEVKKILNDAKTELEKGSYSKKYPESVLSFFSKAFESHIDKCTDNSDTDLKKNVFNWYIKFEAIDNACDDLRDIDVRSFTEWDECPEELYHIELSNGFSSLLDSLLSQLPRDVVRLERPVKTIKWSRNVNKDIYNQCSSQHRSDDSFPILLECGNEKIYADSVVVTASAGFLKENIDTFFSPSLPNSKKEALENIGFGTVNKMYLIYDKAFWSTEDLGFQLVWEYERNEKCERLLSQYPWICDITGFDIVPKFPNILLGWIGGEGARLIETVDDDVVSNVCTDLLRIFLNLPDIPHPSDIIRSSWFSNPYIRGSYSNRTLNYYQNDSTMSDLQQPLYSKCVSKDGEEIQWPIILFAGEAFDKSSFSSAHGAFQSGLKVAEQLITSCSNLEAHQMRSCTS